MIMKTIGLIGGTGWVSTVEYYRQINELIGRELGGLNAARCILYSFNYADINAFNKRGDADSVYRMVCDAAAKLESAGAECLLLCANTLHQFADNLETRIGVPLIHIAEATAVEIKRRQFSSIGLLGTKMTMSWDFYRGRLNRHHIQSLVPDADDMDFINDTIFTELLKGIISATSRERFLRIIDELKDKGAQAIVLGCTEIPLLVRQEDTALPLINTLDLHCRAAVNFALCED